MARTAHSLVWFSEIDKSDASFVGAKGVLLGQLAKEGLPIPKGFVITANAYHDFIRENNFSVKINHLLSSADLNSPKSLEQVAKHIQNLILTGDLSDIFIKEIISSYKKIGGLLDEPLVNLIPDFINGHFHNFKDTAFTNVKGDAVLIDKIKHLWSETYNAYNLFKKSELGISHEKIGVALIVESSAKTETLLKVFTIDAKNNDKSTIIIDGIARVKKHAFSIFEKEKGSKIKISDANIKKIAEIALKIETFLYFPQEITLGIEKSKIYVLDAKPLTYTLETDSEFKTQELAPSYLSVEPASAGIASGPLKFVLSESEIDKVMPGDVIVLNKTDDRYINAIKKASAVVTLNGGRNSHAAIIAKKFGIPAISNARDLIKDFTSGHVVTVNGSKGGISKGGLKNALDFPQDSQALQTATKLYVSLSNPDSAKAISKLNSDGINPLFAESIIKKIGVHPKKIIRDGKKEVFIKKVSEEIEQACKAFEPRVVVYRFSNLTSGDYKALSGGKDFELEEPNPSLGFRGAFRYLHDPESFEMELKAIAQVREKGFTNLSVAIPFARTVDELVGVKKALNKSGLQSSSDFKIWFVLETPSNVVLLDQFLEAGIDGVLIDLNMLSTLTLGADKENFEVSSEFSSLESSIVWSLEHIVKSCRKHNVVTSLFGLGVSENSELVKRLIGFGINSLSVLPDSIEYTKRLIFQSEKNLLIK